MSAGDDVAEALKRVADAVEVSGNKDAAAFLDQFNEELEKPEPRKTLLRASWDNLVNALPTIGTIAGAAGAIAKLFG
jgi:flagellar motor component MotA